MTQHTSGPSKAPPRKRRSLVPVFGFLLVSLLAYADLQWSGAATSGPLERMYRGIGLFTGNSSWAFDPKSNTDWLFRLLAVLAPLLTALGLAELATGAIGPLWVRLISTLKRFGGTREPVAIFGLDDDSLGFAKTLARSRGYLPIIVARNPEELLAQEATRSGVPIVASTRSWWEGLVHSYRWAIGVLEPQSADRIYPPRGVKDIVSFLPTADEQVELAAKLTRRETATRKTVPLRVRLMMADRGLAQRLDNYLKFTYQGDVYPRLVDIDALAARLLLTTHPLDVLADAFDQEQIHLAIYGFGALGRAVAKEAARLYVTRPSLEGKKLRITAIDQDPRALASFLAEDPEIDRVVELEALSWSIARAGFSAKDIATIIPNDVTAHVLAFGDAETTFTAAVSLRRWLLEPPRDLGRDWQAQHRSAPIFIRAPGWSGLGRLVRSGIDHAEHPPPELPDGIFAFGNGEAVLSPDTLLSPDREEAARRVHANYRRTLGTIREQDPTTPSRVGDGEWELQTPQLRDSNFHVIDHMAIKARACGYRLVDRRSVKNEIWPPEGPALVELQRLEHERWAAERGANGWRVAISRCDAVRVHRDLVPWDNLSTTEREFDEQQVVAMQNFADAIGKRLAEGLVVAVTGPGSDPASADPSHIKRELGKALTTIRATHPHRAVVLLSALSAGVELWAAERALALSIPFIVPLPLPYELYQEDFPGATNPDRTKFQQVIARAEYYVELPLRFSASEITIGREREIEASHRERRAQQYAFGRAYILERCHKLIVVGEGPAAPFWPTAQDIPVELRTTSRFLPKPVGFELIRIGAQAS